MNVPELQLGAILLAPIIVAIIELVKKAGMPTQYAPWANAGLSVLGYGLILFVEQMPQYEEPALMVLNMLLVFLSAAGVYDVAKRTAKLTK